MEYWIFRCVQNFLFFPNPIRFIRFFAQSTYKIVISFQIDLYVLKVRLFYTISLSFASLFSLFNNNPGKLITLYNWHTAILQKIE
jgi:hypothetical protein